MAQCAELASPSPKQAQRETGRGSDGRGETKRKTGRSGGEERLTALDSSLLHARRGEFQRARRQPDRPHAVVQPTRTQPRLRNGEARALLRQQVGDRDLRTTPSTTSQQGRAHTSTLSKSTSKCPLGASSKLNTDIGVLMCTPCRHVTGISPHRALQPSGRPTRASAGTMTTEWRRCGARRAALLFIDVSPSRRNTRQRGSPARRRLGAHPRGARCRGPAPDIHHLDPVMR